MSLPDFPIFFLCDGPIEFNYISYLCFCKLFIKTFIFKACLNETGLF
jgi:hypothetical protein